MNPRIEDIPQLTLLRNGFNYAKRLPEYRTNYARGIVAKLTGLEAYQCEEICRQMGLKPGDLAKDQVA